MTSDELELQNMQKIANELKLQRNGSFCPPGIENRLAEVTAKIQRLLEKIKQAREGNGDIITR